MELDLEDMAEMAESMDEFLGALLAPTSARTLDEPAMAEMFPGVAPPRGFEFTTGSDTLRDSFGIWEDWGVGVGLVGENKFKLVRDSSLVLEISLWRQEERET